MADYQDDLLGDLDSQGAPLAPTRRQRGPGGLSPVVLLAVVGAPALLILIGALAWITAPAPPPPPPPPAPVVVASPAEEKKAPPVPKDRYTELKEELDALLKKETELAAERVLVSNKLKNLGTQYQFDATRRLQEINAERAKIREREPIVRQLMVDEAHKKAEAERK